MNHERSREELPQALGQRWRPRGATLGWRSGVVSERSYSISGVKNSSCALPEQAEERPSVQGKRNPGKMVGTERGDWGQTD